jgi:nucleoside-diphosphate-sugar epimerase
METVVVTGGSGRIGSAVIRALAERGYRAVNVDRERAETDADRFIWADLTDAGDTYGALAQVKPDAVVHLGTTPNPVGGPDFAIFRSNAVSTWHVLEACEALDVGTVALASSIHVLGSIAPDAPLQVDALPVDESHGLTPQDGYGLGKETIETLADGFARRPGAPDTISSLRFPSVDTEEKIREQYPIGDGTTRVDNLGPDDDYRDILFAYVHVDDVADLACKCVDATFEGHERFWVSAPDTRAAVPTSALAERYYPDAEIERDLGERYSLVDTTKARECLGWRPERSWRQFR